MGGRRLTPALLSVTANNQSKSYGTALSLDGSEFTAVGLKNTDAISSVSLASAGLAATAPVGNSPYGVTPSAATGSAFAASNYTITYVNGALTVVPTTTPITPVTPPAQPPVVPTPVPPVVEVPIVVVPVTESTAADVKPGTEAQVAGNFFIPPVPEQNAPLLITQVQMNAQALRDPVLFAVIAAPVVPVVEAVGSSQAVAAPMVGLFRRPRRQDRN